MSLTILPPRHTRDMNANNISECQVPECDERVSEGRPSGLTGEDQGRGAGYGIPRGSGSTPSNTWVPARTCIILDFRRSCGGLNEGFYGRSGSFTIFLRHES